MNLASLKRMLRPFHPRKLRSALRKRKYRRPLPPAKRRAAFREHGEFLLDKFFEFLRRKGPVRPEREENIRHGIRHPRAPKPDVLDYYGQVLGTFMPDFRQRLTDLYRMQQFCMMHRFLQYPFIQNEDFMSKKIVPFERAAERLATIRLIDYGCGLPHGLSWLLRKSPSKIAAVTLVDLDMIALEFAEFLVRDLAPQADLEVVRLANTDQLPTLRPGHNLVFGADVFEHLVEPEKAMRNVLSALTLSPALAYFDLGYHGVADQHVCVNTGFLRQTLAELGFESLDLEVDMTEFSRTG